VDDRQILAIGGYSARIGEYLLEIARGPRICFVPTASGDDPWYALKFYEGFRGRAGLTHLFFNPYPPENLAAFVLGQDVIYVSGGNTANALAIWRAHRFDALLREAWESGVVLAGWSAGMVCWFESCVTDSFGPQLEGLRDGLGFVPGSACPHYDGEELRRPRYHELVRGGFPGGYAADDEVGLHFRGTDLEEVVTARAGATAYRVELEEGQVVETPLAARPLE
jgi:peptidase E